MNKGFPGGSVGKESACNAECECEVGQSCLTLCDPVDCSPPGSSVHGDSLGKNTRVGMFPTKGLNPGSFPSGSDGKVSVCNAGDLGSIPGLGRSPGEERGYTLQYSCVSLVVQTVKNPPAMGDTWVLSLG